MIEVNTESGIVCIEPFNITYFRTVIVGGLEHENKRKRLQINFVGGTYLDSVTTSYERLRQLIEEQNEPLTGTI